MTSTELMLAKSTKDQPIHTQAIVLPESFDGSFAQLACGEWMMMNTGDR